MQIKFEFGGGLELIMRDQVKNSQGDIQGDVITVKNAIDWVVQNLVVERPEMFVDNVSVRPGVLVLINGEDWELHDGADAVLASGDELSFISTLHGG